MTCWHMRLSIPSRRLPSGSLGLHTIHSVTSQCGGYRVWNGQLFAVRCPICLALP